MLSIYKILFIIVMMVWVFEIIRNGVIVKNLIVLLMAALLLSACQQETQQPEAKAVDEPKQVEAVQEKQQPAVAENEEQKPAEADPHAGHSHPEGLAPVEGERYAVVESQFQCEEPVVIEFFAYQCPHCNNLEPEAEAWRERNAGKVKFLSIPTHLGNQRMGVLLLVHHAAKALGVLEKTQHALFERVHKEERLFASQEEAEAFLVAQGADPAKVKSVIENEQLISDSVKADFEYLQKYRIASVPQVLVNHKYMTDITVAGGHKEVFDVVDEALQLESDCKAE